MEREDRIRRHRRSLVDVALAETFEIDRLAVTLDKDDGARNSSRGDFALHEALDRRELSDRQIRPRPWSKWRSLRRHAVQSQQRCDHGTQ